MCSERTGMYHQSCFWPCEAVAPQSSLRGWGRSHETAVLYCPLCRCRMFWKRPDPHFRAIAWSPSWKAWDSCNLRIFHCMESWKWRRDDRKLSLPGSRTGSRAGSEGDFPSAEDRQVIDHGTDFGLVEHGDANTWFESHLCQVPCRNAVY